MRILLIGASGLIGRAIKAELGGSHDIVPASRTHSAEKVDITDPASIRALYGRLGRVDAVVIAAGVTTFKPFAELRDEDFALSLKSKLMGQVDVVRFGFEFVADSGSFTITTGTLSRHPERGSVATSLVNAGLEGFARAAALDAPRGIRINAVSPPWLTETLQAMGRSLDGGAPAAVVARLYARSVEGKETGKVLEVEGDG